MRKAQTPAEFMILVGVMLFFFITFIYSLQINNADKIRQQRDIIIKDAAFTVQDEINLALEATDGYERTFTLTRYILGKDYDIDIIEGVVYAETDDGKHAIALPVADVVVVNKLETGDNVIRKTDGVIYLNP